VIACSTVSHKSALRIYVTALHYLRVATPKGVSLLSLLRVLARYNGVFVILIALKELYLYRVKITTSTFHYVGG
jgi:hypothetical protein